MRNVCKLAAVVALTVAGVTAVTSHAQAWPTRGATERVWTITDPLLESTEDRYNELHDAVWAPVDEHVGPVRDAQEAAQEAAQDAVGGPSDQLLDAVFTAAAPAVGVVAGCLPPPFNGYRPCAARP